MTLGDLREGISNESNAAHIPRYTCIFTVNVSSILLFLLPKRPKREKRKVKKRKILAVNAQLIPLEQDRSVPTANVIYSFSTSVSDGISHMVFLRGVPMAKQHRFSTVTRASIIHHYLLITSVRQVMLLQGLNPRHHAFAQRGFP